MSRCVNDLNSVRLLLGVGLLNVVQTPILYAGALAVMFTINVKLALLVLLPYPVFILIARLLGRSIHHWSLMVDRPPAGTLDPPLEPDGAGGAR